MITHLDFETRSSVSLPDIGAFAYAMHPSTEIMCIGVGTKAKGVQVYGGLKRRFIWGEPIAEIIYADILSAHNAPFEYAIYNYILHKRFGWPARWNPKSWSCTMARALMCGLPAALDPLGRVLQIKTPKDLEGRRVMQQLCKPVSNDILDGPKYDETPEKYQRLYKYNGIDVEAEMEVDALLPDLPPHERAIWEQDLLMNNRGVCVDLELCSKAAHVASILTADLNGQLKVLTNDTVDKATQTTALKQYIKSQGVEVPTKMDGGEEKETIDKAAVLGLLERTDIPQSVRDVITIRQQVGKSSTAKYTKTIEAACSDGRVRGVLQYHAAHTGREGGRLIQPQNYPKGFEKLEDQLNAISFIKGDAEVFSWCYGKKAMDTLSDTLRGTIIASPKKMLVCADFNAIEARVLFWLAGMESVLNAYRRGESPYVELAQAIYNDSAITKKSHPKEYDLGKRAFLGYGYGMGGPKFKLTCKIQANITVTDEFAERAKDVYREKYRPVVSMWYATEAAAIAAVRNPGSVQSAMGGRVSFQMSADRRFLECRLPSGRDLRYWKPIVRPGKTPWGEERDELCYWGPHPKTNQWVLLKTYGGALVENIVQAIARDLMANGMILAEAEGYEMLLTIHDELLAEFEWTENSDPFGMIPGHKLKDFIKIMCTTPPWALGCPVSAEGWVGPRYHK